MRMIGLISLGIVGCFTLGGVVADEIGASRLVVDFRNSSVIASPVLSNLQVSAKPLAGQGTKVLLTGSTLDLPNGAWMVEAWEGNWITPLPIEVKIRREAKAVDVALPLVPSCSLASSEWPKAMDEEVEILSLDYGSRFRARPAADSELRIPAGSFLVSRMKAKSRVAITPPMSCAPGERLKLPFPQSPSPGEFALFLELELPEPSEIQRSPAGSSLREGKASGQTIEGSLPAPTSPPAVLVQAGAKVFPPGASTGDYRTRTVVFYRLPADRAVALQVAHATSLTYAEEISGASGTVESPEALKLLPRKRYELDIDYRPARSHSRAELVLSYCGLTPGSWDCQEYGRETLAAGKAFYTLEGLDRGQYRLSAEIDDFVLDGLGRGMGEAAAKLIEYDARPVSPDTFSIYESHIWGNILSDGVSISGRVVLSAPGRESWPNLEFPTDENLLFHIYYFGADETAFTMARDEKRTRSTDQIPRAIPMDYRLAVCSEAGFCRHLNTHSRIRGEGRMDLEMGPEAAAQLTILDAETSQPVQAKVLLDSEDQALIFEEGESRWVEPAGAEGLALRADERGKVQIPLSGDGVARIRVSARGYETFHDEIHGVLGKFYRRTIRLEPASRERVGHQMVFPDGRPVENAFLLPIDARGDRRVDCYRKTNANGFARFDEACKSAAKSILVLHPQAAITHLDASIWIADGETILAPAPEKPPRIKLTRAGEPLVGATVEIQYPDFAVLIDDLLAELLAGHQMFYQSNQLGELVLRGVDPASSPKLRINGRLYPVPAAGQVLELAVD